MSNEHRHPPPRDIHDNIPAEDGLLFATIYGTAYAFCTLIFAGSDLAVADSAILGMRYC